MILVGFVLLQLSNLQILEEVRTQLAMAVSQTHSDTKILTKAASNNGNKLAIINFDDGYKSQYTNAKPILDKYGSRPHSSLYVIL